MSLLTDIMTHNRAFVASQAYEPLRTDRFPNKKLVMLTCMDTRLVELLPNAMNLHQGDFKLIKNAGALVSHPFGSVMRSILVAVYELNAAEVAVVGHHGCGMTGLSSGHILDKARQRGVEERTFAMLRSAGIDLDAWLHGFESPQDGVRSSVEMIRNHPLLPRDVPVHGLIISPETGELELLVDGYAHISASPA